MWNWKNDEANGIPYSRYCASFTKAYEKLKILPVPKYAVMMEWLSSLTINGKKLSEEDKKAICEMYTNGMMELEDDCKKFLETKFIPWKMNK